MKQSHADKGLRHKNNLKETDQTRTGRPSGHKAVADKHHTKRPISLPKMYCLLT